MTIPVWAPVNIFIICLLLFLIWSERNLNLSHRTRVVTYRWILWVVIFSLIFDSISRLRDTSLVTDWYYLILISALIKFILPSFVLPLFYRYVLTQVDAKRMRLRRIGWVVVFAGPLIDTFFVITTLSTGWIFRLTPDGTYTYGQLYQLDFIIVVVSILFLEVFLLANRDRIQPTLFSHLAGFIVAPLICCALQLFLRGLPFPIIGIAFSLIMLYVSILSRDMSHDGLTGVLNRKEMDVIFAGLIADRRKRHFSAVMLDMDHFKEINDQYGHAEGDAVLIQMADILSRATRDQDYICRYGGDEFCAILMDAGEAETKTVMKRIEELTNDYNATDGKPYAIAYSAGYHIYQEDSNQDVAEFLKELDTQLYEMKSRNRQSPSNLGDRCPTIS